MGKNTSDQELYETFHTDKKLQKKIIFDNNFTYRILVSLLKPHLSKVKTVLDIGCGVGTMDFYLADKGKTVTAIDISQNAITTAKENAKVFGLGKKISFFTGIFPHKQCTGPYDLVFLSEVIEHVPDDKKLLHDIKKVLSSNGILIVTTPSINAPLYRLGLLAKFDQEVGHLRRYKKNSLIKMIEQAGYVVISSGMHEGILRNFLFTNKGAGKFVRFIRTGITDVVSKVDEFTIPFFGASNIHIIAQKK